MKVALVHISGKRVVVPVVLKKGKTPVQQALMKLPKKMRGEFYVN